MNWLTGTVAHARQLHRPTSHLAVENHPTARPFKSNRAMHADISPAIVVENLTKIYGANRAVDDVNFVVRRGTTVGLLGGNGAGKTTTMAMILGLVVPTTGRATIFNHDMAHSPNRVQHRLNFVSPHMTMPARLTVRQNLSVFGQLYGVRKLKVRIAELAQEFDFEHLLDQPSGRLSAGQKTRISLGKALLNEPELLLLDEPTASLDPDSADWVRSRLEAYQKRRGASILLASHNMLEVERLCDFVVVMRGGRIVERGAPNELIRRYHCASLEEVFLQIAWAESATQYALGSLGTKNID